MIKCVGFITDPHIPFHNPRHLTIAMSVLYESKIDQLILGGDVADMYWIHDHGPKHPDVPGSLIKEIEETNKFLDFCDTTFPGIPKDFIEGNHENRFERYLVKNCAALFGITEFRRLIKIDERPNWKYHYFRTGQLMQVMKTNLYLKHAPKGSSASTILKASMCNLGFGHIHRIINERTRTADGRDIHIWSPGWLGDERYDKVFGYVPGHHAWQSGFARIWIDDVTWNFWVDIHEIKDNMCIVDGKVYRP